MRLPFGGGMAGRATLVVPVMLIALWLTATITASATLSRTNPALAIRLYGDNARALELASSLAAGELTRSGARRAVDLGTRSLLASPLSSEGAAALGVGRSVLSPRADVLSAFRYSQFLSRRTALAQIWFIEHSVGRGDVPAALRAYDHLFRVSDYYRAQFMPVLVGASAQPEVAREAARLLETQPQWRDEYFSGLLGTFPGADNFALLVRAFRFGPRDAESAHRLSLAMTRLVEAGRPDLAFGVYRQASGIGADASLVRDGDFRQVGGLLPFDWELTENDALVAEIGTNDAGASVLRLSNRAGRPGAFARQLLILRPGHYRMTFAVGDVGGAVADRPALRVECLGGAVLSATVFSTAPEGGRDVTANFSVPAQGCAAQWLVVQAGNPVDALATQQWVSRIRIAAAQAL